MKTKLERLVELMKSFTDLSALIEEDAANDTPENNEQYKAMHAEILDLKEKVRIDAEITGVADWLKQPVGESKAYPRGTDGEHKQTEEPIDYSIGAQFTSSESYKAATADGKLRNGFRASHEAKGYVRPQFKATFDSASTGLDTSRNYVTPPGGIVMIEQQRLMVRDLLSVGQTTQNAIYYIKESSFTNYADMVAEEGEKPEATLATTTATAPVKKIAVVLKVTDEMFADMPQLRDYINTRLRFMVEAKEEQQLLNGTGVGNQITGILQTSGIQTQTATTVSATNPVTDSIHKAMTKIRTAASNVGGYEPDGIIMHPTDYQLIRLTKDTANQYFGGGPFSYGPYGNGTFVEQQPVWGLRVVVTTAIAAGTALVGAFKMGAQIWQREGITVDSTNSNEDDFNFNRVTLRVEERLALAVYRPSAFCTVTSIV